MVMLPRWNDSLEAGPAGWAKLLWRRMTLFLLMPGTVRRPSHQSQPAHLQPSAKQAHMLTQIVVLVAQGLRLKL